MPMPWLEDFESEPPAAMPVVQDSQTQDPAQEEAKLAAYEQGYRAGWDDATVAQDQHNDRIGSELASSLQAMAFTWQEVRMHMLGALEPLLMAIVTRLLPEIASASLPGRVVEVLMPLAEDAVDSPPKVFVHPDARKAVSALLEQTPGLSVAVHSDPSLGPREVTLRLGETELHIDLDRTLTEISAAVQNYFNLSKESENHG